MAARARCSICRASACSSGVIVRVAIFLGGPTGPALPLAVVLNGNPHSHRLFAGVFLRDFRRQPCATPNDEDQFAGFRREAHVVKHGSKAAVDVDWQRFDTPARGVSDGTHEPHAGALLVALFRQREKHVYAVVDGAMNTVSETRDALATLAEPVDDVGGGGFERY